MSKELIPINLLPENMVQSEAVEQLIHAIGISAQIDYEIEDRDIWLVEQSY